MRQGGALRGLTLGAASLVTLPTIALPTRAASQDSVELQQIFTTLEAQQSKLAEQERLLRQQMQELEAQKQALSRQQQQLNALQVRIERSAVPVAASTSVPVSPFLLDRLRGTGTGQTAQAPQPVGQPPAPEEHAPEVHLLADRGGVLTPRGALVYEPSLDFAHTTDTRAIISGFTVLPAILVGSLDVTRVNHDVFQAVNTLRYGITNRSEVEVRIPYVYGRQETTSRPLNLGTSADTTTTITGHGIGDVELAGHYQLNSGQQGWPYLIANLRFKSRTGEDPFQIPVDANGLLTRDPTGSGFYNIEPSLTAIYPSDPAVFFANVGYLVALGRRVNSPLVGSPAQVDPGDAIRFSFGLGFGINEASSFSLGYDYSAFFQTKINHISQPGTDLQIGSVLIGYSYRFSDRFSANLTTEIGVTSDAPDTRVILRFPIKFQIFDAS